jgi:hypothetical protein
LAAVGLLGLAIPGSASAATQIGETFVPNNNGGGPTNTLIQTSPIGYSIPSHGVITSWSFEAPATFVPELKFKLARPAGGSKYMIVGESAQEVPTAGTLNTFPTRIPARAGDVIGVSDPVDGNLGRGTANPSYKMHFIVGGGDVPPGTTVDFDGSNVGFQLDVSAVLEPDCDSDGFGDETQDQNVFGPNCPARGQTVTLDANKSKVKKGKNVTLSGRVTELKDGECRSTQTVEIQRKKPSQSTFTTIEQVQTDAQGNFSTKLKAKKTYEYRAQVVVTPGCGGQVSDTEKVKVKKKK